MKKDLLLINPPLVSSVLANAGEQLDMISLIIEDNLMTSINVGLLSIASYVESKGFSVDIIDLYHDSDLSKITSQLQDNEYRYVGISCVTGYSYIATKECFDLCKQLQPEAVSIGGGPHLGPLGRTALEECSSLDILARYEGELVVEMILQGVELRFIDGIVYRGKDGICENTLPSPLIDLDEMPPYNFELYPDHLSFMPFVEESRGCFAKCSYCVNCFLNQGRIRYKSPDIFERDLEAAVAIYGTERMYVIESLSFGTNPKIAIEILKRLKKHGIKWGVEFRVDAPWEAYIDEMYASGCRMIDVGVESASPTMLKLMNKTRDTDKYLRKAELLIDAAMSYPGMFMSYNVLFFPGETPHTLRETTDFIFKHQHERLMISVFPTFLFPGVPMHGKLEDFERLFGSSVIRDGFWSKAHFYPINLSDSVSFNDALVFSKVLQRMFLPQSFHRRKPLEKMNGNTDWTSISRGKT